MLAQVLPHKNSSLNPASLAVERIPEFWQYLPREGEEGNLLDSLGKFNTITVTGVMGGGKTFLVANVVNKFAGPHDTVIWFNVKEKNDNVARFLLQVSIHLAQKENDDHLWQFLHQEAFLGKRLNPSKGAMDLLLNRGRAGDSTVIVIDNIDNCTDEEFLTFIRDLASSKLKWFKLIIIGRHFPLPSSSRKEIQINGFSKEEALEYVKQYYNELEISEAVFSLLHEKTEGNPLLIFSLLQYSQDRGDTKIEFLLRIKALELHPSLRDLYFEILSLLTSKEKKLLHYMLSKKLPIVPFDMMKYSLVTIGTFSLSVADSLVKKGALYVKDKRYNILNIACDYFKMVLSV